MKVIRCLLLLLITIITNVGAAAEPATPEQITTDLVAQFDRLAPVIERVKDEASAQQAVTELDDIAQKIMALGLRAKGLKASAEQKTKMETRLQEAAQVMQSKLQPALEKARQAGPEALKILQKGLLSWGAAMQKFGNALQESEE